MPVVTKQKIKLKKGAIYFFLAIVICIVVVILGINIYHDYKYKQTNEYKLIEKGYTKEETETLLQKLSQEKIENLLNQEKNEQIVSIVSEKYYLEKNLEKYLDFQKENSKLGIYDVIAMVNVHSNQEWYEETTEADITKGSLLLVNKYYQLNAEYKPEDLVNVSNWYCYGENQLVKEAYESFISMFNKAKEENIKLIINSSYRDYQSQEATYNSIKKSSGTKAADNKAARPGHSEHETGLAFDIFSPGNTSTENFKDSEAYRWLKENAQEYGFIERYPENKEYLTGYNFESWHWRYVGKDIAKQIHEEQITYDEYYAYYIE